MSLKDVPWGPFLWIGVVAVLYSAMVFDFSDSFWDWANTFVATLLSVFAGIFLYRHQSARAEEDRRDQLLTALAGELKSCLGILRAPPSPILVPRRVTTGEDGAPVVKAVEIGEVVLVHLPTVVVEEAMRAAVFDAEESHLLSNIAAHLHVHNSEVSFVLTARVAQVSRTVLLSLQRAVEELKQRQAAIAADNQLLLDHLRSEGIELPD